MRVLLITKIITFVFNFLSTIYVVTLLPVSDFGLYTTILMSIPFLSQIISLSNYEYLLKGLIESDSDKVDGRLLFSTMITPLIISVIIVFFCSQLIKGIPLTALIYIVILCFFEYTQRYYISKSESKFIAFNDFFLNAGWVLIFIVIQNVFLTNDVLWLVFLSRIVSVSLAISIFLLSKSNVVRLFEFSLSVAIESYKFGLPIVIGALSYSLLRGIERILLSNLSSLESAGTYSFIQIPLNVMFALFSGTIFVTSIKYIRLEKTKLGTNNVLNNVRQIVTVLFLPCLMSISLNFDVFSILVGSNKYNVDFVYPVLSSISLFLFMIVSMSKQDLILSGHGHKVTCLFFLALAVNVAFSAVLYEPYGYRGAIVVNLITNLTLCLGMVIYDRVKLDYFIRVSVYSGVCVAVHYVFNININIFNEYIWLKFIFVLFEYVIFMTILYVSKIFDVNSLSLLKCRFGYDREVV